MPYLAGQTAYVDEEWGVMVEAMEESLRLYLKSVPLTSIIHFPYSKSVDVQRKPKQF